MEYEDYLKRYEDAKDMLTSGQTEGGIEILWDCLIR
jgi:hypothetical protein